VSKHLLYIIGQPGSGKSTLAAALTSGLSGELRTAPFAHTVWGSDPPVVELGARRDAFSGTDALGKSVQPAAIEYLRSCPFDLMLAEGDRLATTGFLQAALQAEWDVRILRLTVSGAVALHRRTARAHELGTKLQNETWLKGRVTKVRNLADAWAHRVTDIDADQHPASVLLQALSVGNPVVAALAG
jgi:energy-coupling factor transporter ATP-binding protein EcfA2